MRISDWVQTCALPIFYARDGGPTPLLPPWSGYDDASRLAQAKRVVDAWKAGGREIEPLRIAVPDSPGGRILYAYVAADFDRIGVPSRRVDAGAAADLKLIDEVTPNDDPLWGQIGRANG